MTRLFSIAIDGPCGAGKSSVAQGVASRLGADYLDTGAMYRAVGLYMLSKGVDVNDARAVSENLPGADIKVEHISGAQHVYLNGEDVTCAIREQPISDASSAVARVNDVRVKMVRLQRDIARGRAVVMDGRDIGTDVLPDATLKIYLSASKEARAQRRYIEMKNKGLNPDYDTVYKDLMRRDENDMNREFSPLRKASDAHEVDSTLMNQAQVIDKIVRLFNEKTEGLSN